MVSLQYVSTLFAGPLASGARVTDFAVRTTSQGTFLYAGALPGLGALMSFGLAEGQEAAFVSSKALSTGINKLGATHLNFLTDVPGGTAILATGRFGGEMAGCLLADDGTIGNSRSYADGVGPGGLVTAMATVKIGTDTWIYGTVPNGTGINSWKLAAGSNAPVPMQTAVDDAYSYTASTYALTTGQVGGETWLFTASQVEHGITAFRILADGTLAQTGAIGAADGLGIAAPAAMEAIAVGGTTYLVVASTLSSTLTVLRPDAVRGLVPVDQVVDTLNTRFQAVTAIESFSVGDRAFVLAGGADDGLSLFTLLPDGRLILTTVLADTPQFTLAHVTAITAVQVGQEIQVFVASGNEDGLTQFTFTPGALGQTLSGTPAADMLTGTGGDDILMGAGGNDTLTGGAGADILSDGIGSDALTGGTGADLFVMSADGTYDRITDFDLRFDRIDLSEAFQLYDVAQITIVPTATGAILSYGGDRLEIVSADFASLLPGDFTTASTLNLPRSPVELILAGRSEAGTPGDDTIAGTIFDDHLSGAAGQDSLWGGVGDDALVGGPGGDTLDGGTGCDTADYGTAGQAVRADLADPSGNMGDATGDRYVGIENLAGSVWADDLRGDASANLIAGDGGGDGLAGRGGDDRLDGGAGDDTLTGGAGADTLVGGDGRDRADYADAAQGVTASLADPLHNLGDAAGDTYAGIEDLSGSAFDDRLSGDDLGNQVIGSAGRDTLYGGAGDDTLIGGDGADRIDGGDGFDVATFAAASTGVLVNLLNPVQGTGQAAGDSFVSVEGVTGTWFNDDLRGDAWNNRLDGGSGVDWLTGRAGNDTLLGGDANDNLIGGPGADLLDGGAGTDKVHYSDAASGVLVDLVSPALNTGIAAGDLFVSIESIRGSNFADDLRGTEGDNSLDGVAGDDRLSGRGGSDWLTGRSGNDQLDGGDGNDVLFGGAGADALIGGAETDRAHYGDSFTSVVADMLHPERNTGYAAGDVYAGIENLQGTIGDDLLGGDNGANMITGAKGNDQIAGRGGNDYLIGLDGNDTLAGGTDNDSLLGGAGADQFLFGAGDGRDRILDFSTAQDTLRISSKLPGVTGITMAEVIDRFAAAADGGTLFDFGNGDTLFLKGIADPHALLGHMSIGDTGLMG